MNSLASLNTPDVKQNYGQTPFARACRRPSLYVLKTWSKNGSFCIMANLMLYIGTHSIGTCASLLHIIIIIKPLLKIFNECRSLTGVGELNPYLRSSMNAEV